MKHSHLHTWKASGTPIKKCKRRSILRNIIASICCSVTKSCPALCNPMNWSTPGLPVLHRLSEFAQTHVHWVGDAIQPSHSLSSPSPPALNLSQHQGLFQWVSSSHQVAKVLELQLQHQSFNECSGLISFRIYCFDLAIQGTLKNLLKNHNSKASVIQCSALFMVQLSHPYMTTGKAIALSIWTFVGKVMSLLLSRSLPKIKHLSISWVLLPSAVILEPKKIISIKSAKRQNKKWESSRRKMSHDVERNPNNMISWLITKNNWGQNVGGWQLQSNNYGNVSLGT